MELQEKVVNGFRISPQQKHLWTLQQLEQGQPYRVQYAVLIEGNLDKSILNLALQNVVNKHEILRTTFQCLPGMTIPLQVIADCCPLAIYEHDLTGFCSADRISKIDFIFNQIRQQGFDLEQGSVLYTSLVIWSAQQHILLLSLSAMNADNITLVNLVREISSFYAAIIEGKELSEQPLQYADIAEWQYELLQSEDTAIAKEYWQKLNFTSKLEINLPFEKKVANCLEFKPEVLEIQISDRIFQKIKSLILKHDANLSSFLLTCWQVLIWKTIQKPDIVIGIASNGRKYEELESALGLLSKYIPLSNSLKPELKFNDLWRQIEQLANEANNWQEYFHWEDFIDENNSDQELPFFPVCFESQPEINKYCEAELSFSIYKQLSCINKFKVKLAFLQKEDTLYVDFYYDASLLDLGNIKYLAEQFETLLASAVNQPEAAISQLEVLSDRALDQLLTQFNNTSANYPKNICIHYLFEQQVERTPNATAVIFENQQLTYKELNARANQLANYLQKLGVSPEVIVGIGVERSLDMVIAMLGILKAGGAYLPLDPAMPTERLGIMLQDAQISVLLTQQHLVNKLSDCLWRSTKSDRVTPIVCLDTDWETIKVGAGVGAGLVINSNIQPITLVQNPPLLNLQPINLIHPPLQNPNSKIQNSANLAYIIYTSGSTGTPKGVAIEHQQLLNYLHGILPRLDLPSGSSFATVSTFAADLGNTAIFPALCTGGCLHIISQERAADPEALAEYFRRHPIDCLKIVPSHLAALLTSSQPEAVLPCKRLVLGGEAASWDLIEKVQEMTPDCLIINHYGPTETTVGVLTYQVNSDNLRHLSTTVPLGRAIANTQTYILDSHLQPVPIGVAGELYIGGDSLGRGYLNQPELTAQKFIPNPFKKAEGRRRRRY